MSKKKSYMSIKNILSEGFLDKLFKIFKTSKEQQAKIKRKQDIKKSIKDLNKSQSKLEKGLSREFGKKITLNRYTLKDFI